MTEGPVIPAPKGLQKPARGLWRSVLKAYNLRPDELVLLESACWTLDFVARLDAELVDAPLTVRGSMGQERENPLLSERRQQSAHLARLMAQLKLPDLDAPAKRNQQRDAGLSRWSSAHGKPVNS